MLSSREVKNVPPSPCCLTRRDNCWQEGQLDGFALDAEGPEIRKAYKRHGKVIELAKEPDATCKKLG
eukprot:3529520-Amphidinium_carterae.2